MGNHNTIVCSHVSRLNIRIPLCLRNRSFRRIYQCLETLFENDIHLYTNAKILMKFNFNNSLIRTMHEINSMYNSILFQNIGR